MNTGRSVCWASILLVLGLAASPALSQDTDRPASVLIFPLYDASAGAGTIVCVTNTNTDSFYCPDRDQKVGDVLLHYLYVDGDTWQEFDRYEFLTPGDTLCVIASEHNVDRGRGFLVVTAHDANGEALIGFDHLIGSAIVVQSGLNFLWSYPAYGMQTGRTNVDCTPSDPDAIINGGDGDGVPDYDGVEYAEFPEVLMIDTFFEEGGDHAFHNQLTIMSTSGREYKNELDFLFFNNIEQKFSRSFQFTCWWSGSLSEISSIAGGLGGDEVEFGHKTETGWARFEGARIIDGAGNPVTRSDSAAAVPALMGVFMQGVNNTNFAFGKGLHFQGTVDGQEIERGDSDPQQP